VIWSTASCIRASVLNVLPMKKVKRAPMTQLPATFVEAEAVDAVAHWFDLTDAMLRTENSRLVMRAYLKRLIRQGTIPTLRVIGWANSGSEEADKALREIAAEMLDAGESPPANIRYYAASALIQPSQVKRGKGNDAAENWLRDQCIAVIVSAAIERWYPYLPVSRNRASRKPSACSVVSAALVRRGINIGTRRVEKIYKEYADLLPAHRAWQLSLSPSNAAI
jgi:hypothetical protein